MQRNRKIATAVTLENKTIRPDLVLSHVASKTNVFVDTKWKKYAYKGTGMDEFADSNSIDIIDGFTEGFVEMLASKYSLLKIFDSGDELEEVEQV